MNQKIFFEHFEVLADTPNSVQKLREVILQLAVQGKLVPQDPNDEPASFLIEKIMAERKKLVEEGKVKNDKKLADINDDEVPIDLPKGWAIERFGKMIYLIRGASPRPKGDPRYFSKERTPFHWIKISDIRKYAEGLILRDTDEFLTEEGAKKSVYLEKGTFILSNSATIGVPTILGINGCIHDGYLAFPHLNENHISIKYLYYFFLYFQGELKKKAFGGAQLNLNTSIVKSIAFPLPPLDEQKRIVSKVDQLMAHCDQLEARQQKKHEQRIRLNNAALDKLLTAPTPGEFAQYWQRICDNFDLLYDAPETVGQLRQAILQLAVQGKLVVQDPGDEPAAVLIEKVTAEKERLIKEGKISKSKPLPSISVDEIYFELPYGWQWVRFDDICSYTQRGKGPKYVEKSDILVVSQKCIQWDGFKLDRARFISPSSLEKYNEERFLRTGDLLWNSTGTGTIGRVNVYFHEDNSYDKVVADSHVTVIRPILLNSRFIYCWIANPMIQNEIEEMASGTTNQIELNLSTIKNQLVPLPPLQEQHRIVAKVDQLMALCDELEAGLVQAQTEGGKLMEAVVHHVLAA